MCVETYTSYHLSAIHGERAGIEAYVPEEFLEPLNRCHRARRIGVALSADEKRRLFTSFFLWEQDNVVGPGVDAAITSMDWPLIKWIALKPAIGFRYFGFARRLYFRDFADKNERIAKGMLAFELAVKAGWDRVEHSLRAYGIMPDDFVADAKRHFQGLRSSVLLST